MGRGRLRIGTSGFHYAHWRGVFYPPAMPPAEWFDHYARAFDSVEINNTFYRLPEPEVFDAWRGRAPPAFCFALKFSRFGSHMKRLRTPRETLRPFMTCARRLGHKLGPILVQLPPRWRADPERLDAFLAATPRARRFAVEFRDPSWLAEPVLEVLRARRAALCIHDLLDGHPRVLTTAWTYLRFHGPAGAADSSYSPQALTAHAGRIRAWLERGVDVYAFFNNDIGGHAVENAIALRRYVARRPSPRRSRAVSR